MLVTSGFNMLVAVCLEVVNVADGCRFIYSCCMQAYIFLITGVVLVQVER